MGHFKLYLHIPLVMLFAFMLCACSGNSEVLEESGTTAESLTATLQQEEIQETEEAAPDYMKYIPVFDKGTEKNLYDIMQEDCLIYIQKYDCDDCARDHDVILEHAQKTGLPYIVLEASKKPEEYDGLAIGTKVVRGIGLTAVPSLCFVRGGKFITYIQDAFTKEGKEIDDMAASVYGSGFIDK